MSEPVKTMQPIGPEPVGWETDREWELEQRAFHCNENWPFEDVRQLVDDLWFQYCNAANPIRMEAALAAKDAEIARLTDEVKAASVGLMFANAEIDRLNDALNGDLDA